MELALAAGLAVGLGYWLDGLFGIRPVLTLVLFVWAVTSLGVLLYYRYRADMERHEASQVWKLESTSDSSSGSRREVTEPVARELAVSDFVGTGLDVHDLDSDGLGVDTLAADGRVPLADPADTLNVEPA